MQPRRHTSSKRAELTACCVVTLSATLWGCGTLQNAPDLFTKRSESLPRIQAARDTIQLEILYVERSAADPVLGNLLWKEVDQASGLTPEDRAMLELNGFRVGQVGSTPPRVLQSLLGMKTDIPDAPIPNDNSLTGRRINIPSGSETLIQANDVPYPDCTIRLQESDGEKTERFDRVRCVFRLKAERLQDGWVKLKFLPEIHHAQAALRPVATDTAWETVASQRVKPLYDQQFEVNLNLGEMVLLTANGDEPQSVAHHFFLGPDPHAPKQRLLIVRLADMNKVAPLYAE